MFLATILQWRHHATRRRAFEHAMREHGAALSRVAVAYAPPGALREDLEQEIALGVWEALPRWKQDASLKTFLFRVAHNRCIDLMRKHRLDTTLDPQTLTTTAPSPETHTLTRQRLTRAQDLIRALPLAQAQALTLQLEGLTLQEIANVMGLNPNHVGVLIHRARATLRDHMEHDT